MFGVQGSCNEYAEDTSKIRSLRQYRGDSEVNIKVSAMFSGFGNVKEQRFEILKY